MILIFTFEANGIIVSAEVTEESIKAKKDQIKKQKEQRDSLNTAKTDLEKLKQGLEKNKSDLKKYISELDASLTEIQKKIDALNDTIGKKEAEIKKTAEDLEEAERTQEAQYEAMKKRIKFMYERGDKLYFELFVGTGNFSDMLNKAEYIEMIAAYDRKKLNEYVATTELIALNKQALEEEKETLDLAKSNKEEEEGKMQTLIDAKGVELNNVSTDIKSKEAAIAEYEAEIKAENATIAALEKEVAEHPEHRNAQRKLAEEVTRFVHGEAGLAQAQKVTEALFSGNIQELSGEEIEGAFRNTKGGEVHEALINIVEALVQAGVEKSKRQAREDVKNGAIRVNGVQVKDIEATVSAHPNTDGKFIIVRKGKKNYFSIAVK